MISMENMASKLNAPANNTHQTIINVAVAVIYHQDQYLLGFRNASQHQGNRYEFVGGKIETHETAKQALIREVAEETGMKIDSNTVVKLGRLHHDYGDKQVCLQVYQVALTAEQYQQQRHCRYGLEGQALTWVDKSELLAGGYDLPAANQTILEWLRLPAQIAITYPWSHFSDAANPTAAWLKYHEEHLTRHTWVYIRLKQSGSEGSARQLMHLRPDIQAIFPYCANGEDVENEDLPANHQITALHLTHEQLMQWFNEVNDGLQDGLLSSLDRPRSSFSVPDMPLIISCHDVDSIYAANQLAAMRVQNQRSAIIGVFLSPVLATKSHPDTDPLGWQAWSALAQLADMPIIGLGGLSPAMGALAAQYGGVSIAGIRQFLQP